VLSVVSPAMQTQIGRVLEYLPRVALSKGGGLLRQSVHNQLLLPRLQDHFILLYNLIIIINNYCRSMALNPPLNEIGEPFRIEGEHFIMQRKGIEFQINVEGLGKMSGNGMVSLFSSLI
jgi:hypothetical protein